MRCAITNSRQSAVDNDSAAKCSSETDDRIIVDDDSMPGLESKVSGLAPATVYSRLLAARSSRAA